MRCPACGSDTTPALPRCTRCDAPLNDGASPTGDATRRDDGWPSSPPWPSEPGAPEPAPGPYPAGNEAPYPAEYGRPGHESSPYGSSQYGTPESGAPEHGPGEYGAPSAPPGEHDFGRPPQEFGHGQQQQTELDAGYSSPPTAYDPGVPAPRPSADPGPAYDPNAAYDPGAAYNPGAAYAPNAAYDPGAAYGPPPEPWGGGAGLSATPPPPPDAPGVPGEHTITLSPEPWAAEPQVWSPPPPPERKKGPPYLLIATGLVVLAAIALGIVFWPNGSGKADRAGSTSPATTQETSQVTTQGQPSETPSPTASSPSGDLTEQAGKVNSLLDDMSSTRGNLQTVLTDGCETAGLQRIKGERQSELSTAQGLDVSAVDGGQQLKDALVRALQASVASNAKYIELSPGCPSDSDVADVNQQATDAKREFIGLWNPVATKAGLSPRSEAGI
ncbi:hypothetical protein [Actinomadura oligospora]|uniref:hypothetical protein n=1 Tax=Actinomadura oligospora TaxID=111804 RepID=UPI0004BB433C|nr:hypothetical protein [Actinomadura oligospora]